MVLKRHRDRRIQTLLCLPGLLLAIGCGEDTSVAGPATDTSSGVIKDSGALDGQISPTDAAAKDTPGCSSAADCPVPSDPC